MTGIYWAYYPPCRPDTLVSYAHRPHRCLRILGPHISHRVGCYRMSDGFVGSGYTLGGPFFASACPSVAKSPRVSPLELGWSNLFSAENGRLECMTAMRTSLWELELVEGAW